MPLWRICGDGGEDLIVNPSHVETIAFNVATKKGRVIQIKFASGDSIHLTDSATNRTTLRKLLEASTGSKEMQVS